MQDPNGIETMVAPKQASELLVSERVNIGPKVFFFDLKQNQRGRFVKITEDANGRRNTVMVPIEGLRDCALSLARILDWDTHNPAVLDQA